MKHTFLRSLLPVSLLAGAGIAQDDGITLRGELAPSPRALSATAGNGFELEVLFVNSPGHPTNVIPGLGLPFDPGGSSAEAFRRPWFSASGMHWAIEVDADSGSPTSDNVYLVDGVALLREGDQAPWAPTGETVGTLDDMIGINSLGELLITNNTGGTAASTADDYVVRIDAAGSFTVVAVEGQPVDAVLPQLAGATWDDVMTSPVLTDSGLAGWQSDGVDGTPAGIADDELFHLGTSVLAGEGIVPQNQAGGTQEAWENLDNDDFYASPDGTTWLVQGDLTGPTSSDDVLAINNVILLQEGSIVPGSSFTNPIDSSGIVKAWLDEGGNWFARGNNDQTEQDWVVRNGVVVAISDVGQPITPGSNETWNDTDFGDCFFAFDGNPAGDFVIGGVTDASPEANGVLVLYGADGSARVVCRENDPVDLDGNGRFDDDRFFNTFGNDDVLLLPSGRIVVVATLRDGTGTAVDQGMFAFEPVAATCTVRNGTGANPVDYACITAPVLGSTWRTSIATGPTTLGTFQLIGFGPSFGPPTPFGEVLIALSPPPTAVAGTASGELSLPIPALTGLLGAPLSAQGIRIEIVGGTPWPTLLNALDLVLGR